jgi:anti-sigma factor RsiW
MSECKNLEVRDLLPALARGELTNSERAVVEEHLAACAACRAELELVRDVASRLRNTPAIDTARITQAVLRAARERRERPISLDHVRRRRTAARRVWLVAASLMAVAAAGALAVFATRDQVRPDPVPEMARNNVPVVSPAPPEERTQPPRSDEPQAEPRSTAGTELVMGGGVSDLADADLESLLGVLDGLDVEIDVEPAVLLPLLEGDV